MLEDASKDRHYLNVGRIAAAFAACEDHAAYLLFATRNGRLPSEDEHLPLAARSYSLRSDVEKELAPDLAADLDRFAEERNRLAHSVMRYDYIESDPAETGIALILGFENHRTIQPRTGKESALPSQREIDDLAGEMNLWCRERWISAKEAASDE